MWFELLIVATLSIAVALMFFGAGLYFGHRNERKAFKPVHGEWRLWQEQPPPKKSGQIILVKHPGEQYQLLTWDRYDARDRDWFWFDLSECRKLNRYNFKFLSNKKTERDEETECHKRGHDWCAPRH
jgi:hypothetical protein